MWWKPVARGVIRNARERWAGGFAMGLQVRWYTRDRARWREAWRWHRPPERIVHFEVFVRSRGRKRRLLAALGVGMVVAGVALLWSGETVPVNPERALFNALDSIRNLGKWVFN